MLLYHSLLQEFGELSTFLRSDEDPNFSQNNKEVLYNILKASVKMILKKISVNTMQYAVKRTL